MSKLTVREIAALAGVSPSTVTRVLQDHPRITDETKQKVRNIIHQYNQKPLGVLIANPMGNLESDNFFADVINGANEFLQGSGRQILLETFDGKTEHGLPAIVTMNKVSGLIVGGIPIDDAIIKELCNTKLPIVFIGRYLDEYENLNAVIPDNVTGGQKVAEHLLECGYEHFVFMGGNLRTNTFADRLQGFRQALESNGREISDDQIIVSEMTQQGGYAATKQLIDKLPPQRTGIFAATDWMAAGVLRAFQEEQVRIPQEVGIVGYSDIDLASHIYPSLSSVRVEKQQLGWLAARTLIDQLDNRFVGPVQIHLQPQLVARETTVETYQGMKEED